MSYIDVAVYSFTYPVVDRFWSYVKRRDVAHDDVFLTAFLGEMSWDRAKIPCNLDRLCVSTVL